MSATVSVNCPTCNRVRTIYCDFVAAKVTAVCSRCNPLNVWRQT